MLLLLLRKPEGIWWMPGGSIWREFLKTWKKPECSRTSIKPCFTRRHWRSRKQSTTMFWSKWHRWIWMKDRWLRSTSWRRWNVASMSSAPTRDRWHGITGSWWNWLTRTTASCSLNPPLWMEHRCSASSVRVWKCVKSQRSEVSSTVRQTISCRGSNRARIWRIS